MNRTAIMICALLSVLATPVLANQVSAHSGTVSAVLQYAAESNGSGLDLHSIQISRDGHQVYAGALPNGFDRASTDALPGQPLLSVRELDDEGEPEIIVATFTGGAHCCFGAVIYGYDQHAGAYRMVARDFSDTGFSLEQIGGLQAPLLLSADARFAYQFTSYASSAFPIQIWRYSAGDLLEVTRCYPALISADAKRDWAAIADNQKQGFPITGVLAAYAADEYLLGEGQTAMKQIKTSGFKDATSAFIAQLATFLANNGYVGSAGPSCSAPAK